MKKAWQGLLCLSMMMVLVACGSTVTPHAVTSYTFHSNALQQAVVAPPTPTPPMSIPSQQMTPTPKPNLGGGGGGAPPSSGCVIFSHDATLVPAKDGGLAAPYGPAPTSSMAQQYASELFQLINSDRAACGLPAFSWNSTLASGALLHSWNMAHCGFSHTCPDGMTQYQRIANEGFAGLSDCGENIGGAADSWASVSSVQASMENEPVTGWHRIHLFSSTLHRMGIGVYIDSGGYVWFTEDMVS